MQDKNIISKKYKFIDTVTKYQQIFFLRYCYRLSSNLYHPRYCYIVSPQISKELLEILPNKYLKDVVISHDPIPFTAFLYSVLNYECSFELIIIGSLSYAPGFVYLFVVVTFPE